MFCACSTALKYFQPTHKDFEFGEKFAEIYIQLEEYTKIKDPSVKQELDVSDLEDSEEKEEEKTSSDSFSDISINDVHSEMSSFDSLPGKTFSASHFKFCHLIIYCLMRWYH